MENPVVYVDSDNKIVGGGSIAGALEDGFATRIVRIFIVNSDNQLLLQKRSPDAESCPGMSDQSAGGHVDVGESN